VTARALVSGVLFRQPERKIAKSGKSFTAAKLRDGAGDSVVWWSVVAFAEEACEELLGLRDGDAVAVSGPFTVSSYKRNGEIRLNHSIVAERLITARLQRFKAERRDGEPRDHLAGMGRQTSDLNDPIPF
jgi:single-stranded DNA-binding protein